MRAKRVWFAHGKIIDGIYCAYCDVRRKCRLVRDRHLWRGILSCGHVRVNMGLTIPYEELERKGYINQKGSEDPRFTAHKKMLFDGVMAFREEVLKRRDVEERFAEGRGVF